MDRIDKNTTEIALTITSLSGDTYYVDKLKLTKSENTVSDIDTNFHMYFGRQYKGLLNLTNISIDTFQGCSIDME